MTYSMKKNKILDDLSYKVDINNKDNPNALKNLMKKK